MTDKSQNEAIRELIETALAADADVLASARVSRTILVEAKRLIQVARINSDEQTPGEIAERLRAIISSLQNIEENLQKDQELGDAVFDQLFGT